MDDKYVSPIKMDIEVSLDEALDKLIVKYNLSTDKEELLKALKYDRTAYSSGFKTGYDKGYLDATMGLPRMKDEKEDRTKSLNFKF